MHTNEYFSPAMVARMLEISTSTLSNWRKEGSGPRFSKFGKSVRYKRDDIAAWIIAASGEVSR